MNQSMNRHARRVAEAKARVRGTTLDRLNDADPHGFLHPTRGYRRISPKRHAAATLISFMRMGFGLDLADAREVVRQAA